MLRYCKLEHQEGESPLRKYFAKYRSLIMAAFVIGFVTVFWLIKSFYFIHELELNPHKKFNLLAASGVGLMLGSFLSLKSNKIKYSFIILTYFLLSLLLYSDVVYERYYDAILHIELLGQAGQLGDVIESIISLLYWSDIWYWADFPLLLLLITLHQRYSGAGLNTLLGAAVGLGGVAMLLFSAYYPLKDTFSDQYKTSLTGVLPAHIYDISQTFLSKAFAKEITEKELTRLEEIKDYFKTRQDQQKDSPYFGQFKGRNLIIIQAESLNDFPIGLSVYGQEVTPNLNNLAESSHYYNNIYLQIGRGNTSDAEFVANNSLYPMSDLGIYKTYPNNTYRSLGKILQEEGYSTSASHGNSKEFWNRGMAYAKQGYQEFYHRNHFKMKEDEIIELGVSDESLFKQMIPIYKESKKPFYSFIVSLTNHRPFKLPSKYEYMNLPGSIEGTNTGNYLQAVHYFDKSLGIFIEELKKEDLWDDTIFAVYGDHYGPIPKDRPEIKKILDIDFDTKEQFNIPLIIHHPGQIEGVQNESVGSQIDIYPTLSSLIGVDQQLAQMGRSLDTPVPGFAGFYYETTPYTFYSDSLDYLASHDGRFESGKCIDAETNEPVELAACRPNYDRLKQEVDISKFLLENDLIGEIK